MSTTNTAPFGDIPFDELSVGEVRSTSYDLGAEMIAALQSLVDGTDAESVDDVVSPAVYCSFLPMFCALGGRMEQGSIHTHQSVTVYEPAARIGDVLEVAVTVTQTSVDGDRRRVVVATSFSHEGRPVCSTRSHYLWGFSAPAGDPR